MTPFFSVIIPVYNRASILGRALGSILAQSCADFEVIVVDDGSTDDPASVIAQFDDPRILYIRQRNRGGGAARNAGIDAARGRYIAPLDSDDEFLPGHLERMKQLLHNGSGMVGYARVLVDRGRGRVLLKPPRAIRAGEHMATYLLCTRGFVPTITVTVETAVARRVRYSEYLRFGEDTDFAIRLYLEGCGFAMLQEAGAIWHDLPDSTRASANRKGARLAGWIEELRPRIPPRAYYGCRGWSIAKGIVTQDRLQALRLYLSAALRGCYSPRLAAIIFLQIFLPDGLYRRLADIAVGFLQRVRGVVKGKRALAPAAA
ncbi:MAG: glycosyltransferase family 2 protein [Alphaproteobacteria bacterium]|nr:glycosyltransferase family 2 protein [Alphaproteobacteria bacterium]